MAAGFASLTMESVAARARTGVAVLYRRWSNKDDLVLAALQHERGEIDLDRTHRPSWRCPSTSCATTCS